MSLMPMARPPGIVAGGGGGASSVLLLHFDGSNHDTTTTDSSASAHSPITFVRNAEISTTQSVFGGSSLSLSGSGGFGIADYISIPTSTDFDFGGSDFTLNARVYFNSVAGAQVIMGVWDNGSSSAQAWYMQMAGDTLYFIYNEGAGQQTYNKSTGTLSTGVWYAFAIDYDSATSTIRWYLDGTQIGSQSLTISPQTVTTALVIGALKSGADYFNPVNGYVEEVRILNGTSEYKGSYTLETSAFTS